MSTEQSPESENSASSPEADTPPPPPSAPAETPPPAPTDTPPPAPSYTAPSSAPATEAKDKKILAGILGIVLGCYGVHKFVLGYTKEGIIMLVIGIIGMFTCFPIVIVGIIGLIEGIIYLTKTDEEFNRIYLQGRKPWF